MCVCLCVHVLSHMYTHISPTLPPKKTEAGKEKRRDWSWGYNEKRQCKNNIVASVGSHIYPLRFFQSKHSPFINERGTLLSTWKLHLRSWEEGPHPGTFSVLPHCLEQTPPPLKIGLGVLTSAVQKRRCQYQLLRQRDASASLFFQLQQFHLTGD